MSAKVGVFMVIEYTYKASPSLPRRDPELLRDPIHTPLGPEKNIWLLLYSTISFGGECQPVHDSRTVHFLVDVHLEYPASPALNQRRR